MAGKFTEQVVALVAEGVEPAVVASRLGITRDAVTGILFRARDATARAQGRPRAAVERRTRPSAPSDQERRRAPFPLPPMPDPSPIESAPAHDLDGSDDEPPEPVHPVMALTDTSCPWPFGDPKDWRTGGFRYCMAVKATELCYCPDHQLIHVRPE